MGASQHQHYVPRLLLKGFLSRDSEEAKKEQVRVFDLIEQRSFPTSIDNIMGEHRFNEWWLDEKTMATIEPAVGRIESHLAPLIRRIRRERRLERTPEVFHDLALLMALQYIRTKRMRLLPKRLDDQFRVDVKKRGFNPDKVQGLVDWDEKTLKKQHVKHQIDGLAKCTGLIAEKKFFLMTAPEGSSFYLGDHPVALYKDEDDRGVIGDLDLEDPYIQIYLPLSADMMLCAYGPVVLDDLMKNRDEQMAEVKGTALKHLMDGRVSAAQMKEMMERAKASHITTQVIGAICTGEPWAAERKQVQLYNLLQASYAHRFVVDPDGKFEVARETITKH